MQDVGYPTITILGSLGAIDVGSKVELDSFAHDGSRLVDYMRLKLEGDLIEL